MTEETNAALTDGITLDSDEGQITEEVTQEVNETESAPVKEEESPSDGFQARINKVTADKYAEKRRADELQRRLDELQKPQQEESKAPSLEELNYDEDAYRKAQINYEVQQALEAQRKTEQEAQAKQKAQEVQSAFNERVAAFGKEDFAQRAESVPLLPNGVAEALMLDENGPELIYHLGSHLDQADRIANMSPQQAMMELGRMSANLSAKNDVKLSAAPEPIEPINSGGALTKERGPEGAIFE